MKAEVTPRKLNISAIMAIGRDVVTSPVTATALSLSPVDVSSCADRVAVYVSAILSIQADLAPTLDAHSPPSKPHADRGREGKSALFGWQNIKNVHDMEMIESTKGG